MQPTRRSFLNAGLVTAASALVVTSRKPEALVAQVPPSLAPAPITPMPAPAIIASAPPVSQDIRRAAVHNLHTGDRLDAVYFENGKYVPQALAAAMRVLRDWRNGEEHVMDPGLFDVLHQVATRVDSRRPFQIISGYRSPQSNAAMHARSSGVASHSQHVLGRALDIRLDGVSLNHLHAAALSLRAGGVGLYPVSNFVHVDVGPVRSWQGS